MQSFVCTCVQECDAVLACIVAVAQFPGSRVVVDDSFFTPISDLGIADEHMQAVQAELTVTNEDMNVGLHGHLWG